MNDERHDKSFIFVSCEYFGDFFEAFSGQHPDLVLLVSGAVLEYADEVAEHILLLVYPAHLRDFGSCDSLQQQHLFIGDVREFT